MLLRVETMTNEVFYINENQITYIEKLDVTKSDEKSAWQVHLAGESQATLSVNYNQITRRPFK
ncbi:hypothetical protein [Loigolactobacillus coryniformis]|uniref:Uncharacterized protein n=1 Tax=Loigolactobacillus coryniformis TaxID=1610 RepID=A0A5B8TD82_9LACO|nr:hypothetical protein [Loigolactobacillus coryniformis]QEA52367.1 hypothetical protein FGL77_02880 [Loigolactobacillus coryniformis]